MEESKLINIEARDSKWVMYSTMDSSIVNGDMVLESVELKSDTFYNVKKNDELFLVYAVDVNENALTVNISRLRSKLMELGYDNIIETRKGIGYRIV